MMDRIAPARSTDHGTGGGPLAVGTDQQAGVNILHAVIRGDGYLPRIVPELGFGDGGTIHLRAGILRRLDQGVLKVDMVDADPARTIGEIVAPGIWCGRFSFTIPGPEG